MTAKVINDFSGDYRFLSNFFPVYFTYQNYRFSTSEHAYQAMKASTLEEFLEVQQAPTPGKAKRLGQVVSMRPDFEENKDLIMESILLAKFSNPFLGEHLLKTEDSVLVEGNSWHDNYWGDCFCDRCVDIPGKNTLGYLLMKVRTVLSQEPEEEDAMPHYAKAGSTILNGLIEKLSTKLGDLRFVIQYEGKLLKPEGFDAYFLEAMQKFLSENPGLQFTYRVSVLDKGNSVCRVSVKYQLQKTDGR